ncbi:unnamed protein product [Caenorhabditis sp. 36 PRJEB53466]|nr:unnamed protein product [Caenorhabditis sp. 36 PRJEB53466]
MSDSELNSSLCQLSWLIAKEGIGNGGQCVMNPVPEPLDEPVPVAGPQVAQPSPGTEGKRRRFFAGNGKPPFSYSELIRHAIEETEEKRCTLADIYAHITRNYAFYRENRNSSWKNSIRHNLSLNKQFARIERNDGERRGWWICVDPPEKKPRLLKGEPTRVNPIYTNYLKKEKTKRVHRPEEVTEMKQEVNVQEMPLEDPYISEVGEVIEVRELTEEEINDLNLFESYDLNSSFRVVYDQIFMTEPSSNVQKKAAQIDWLKISLETAGLDYNDDRDMAEVDTEKLKDFVRNGFPEYESEMSTPRTETSRSSSDSRASQPIQNDESDDDFDWNSLL